MRNVSWFGLEEEEQIAVFLCLFVVREEALLQFEAVCQVVCDFVLLLQSVPVANIRELIAHLFQCHAILDKQGYPRVEISHILLKHEVLLRLRRDLRLEFAEDLLGCQLLAYVRQYTPIRPYLWPDHPQSRAPCPWQTWTGTAP